MQHNARALARVAAPARLICVVKANAYGHGAARVAAALRDLDEVEMLAVASVDEGAELRAAAVNAPILLLSALLPAEAPDAARWALTPTIWTGELARAWSEAARKTNSAAPAHFKVDTGMARLGVHWCEAPQRWRELQAIAGVKWRGVYTHLACADDENDEFSAEQIARFWRFVAEARVGKNVLKHLGNSAATLRYPLANLDLVRPGLALYGVHPCPQLCAPLDLKPVMTWKSRVTEVRAVAAGQTVSYGATWRAARASAIAVIACGYADGYPRRLSNRGEIAVGGARCPIVGRVTMDQIMVDVTDARETVQIGDEAVMWGAALPVEEVAACAETIAYELLCGVSARVPRVYC